MELTDYQKRDAHIIKYCEYMIAKCEGNMEKYNCHESKAKRGTYKDILFKITKNG